MFYLQEAIVAPESEGAAQAAASSWWLFPVFLVGVYFFGCLIFARKHGFNPLKWRIGG